ncbi:unnamed protein product [Miscanthus lutarioriparius]|uniref:Transposase n=1 Tax=Miscanthus lutarioriparius TaxID=422564 RepID=A0A811QKH1_9POAL|nr:unnamed protein product [Miscanthus lutarioriparius]
MPAMVRKARLRDQFGLGLAMRMERLPSVRSSLELMRVCTDYVPSKAQFQFPLFLQFEDHYLQPWIDTMQPTLIVKGRHTIRSDCFKKFEDLKKELHTELQSLDSRVCLTSDIWTASQNLGYMAITAQYVDAEFKIKKKIIWFKVLEYPHSGFAIEEETMRCLTEWGLRYKLFTLTLDNASNHTSACEELVRNLKHELLFEEPPTEEEWAKAAAVSEFLKAFEELTLVVSAHREPPAHRFLPLVLCILHALKDLAWQSTDLLKELAVSMHSKFEKYWNPTEDDLHNVANRKRKKKEIAFSVVLVIATALDPRRKADYLKFFIEKVFSDPSKTNNYVRYALEWMRKYFTLYEQRCASSVDMMTRANPASTTVGSPVLGKRKLEVEFAQYTTRLRVAQARKSEIDTYLEEPLEGDNDDFDILTWWKSRSDKFPVLSTMVPDFLAIPLSTVSSESAFSLGERILGERRSSLMPEMLKALVCAKDWLFKTAEDQHLELEGLELEEGSSSSSFD